MPRIPGIRRVFRIALRSGQPSAEIEDELRFHLACRVDELVASGTGETEARRIAQREFGDFHRYREHVLAIDRQSAREREMRLTFESVRDDLRHAARVMIARPGFTLVAVSTLALGIGATTAMFSAVSGVLLRPLPYADVDRIVHLGERELQQPGRGGTTSWDNFRDWRQMSRSFAAMGLYNTWASTLTGHGEPQRVQIAGVTAGMLDVFHVRPMLGRAFTDADNVDGAPAVAVVSWAFWKSKLGGDSGVIGRTLMLNFTPIEIVGVLPERFTPPASLDRPIWVNFSDDTDGRGGRSKNVYALLRPGVTVEQAQAEMAAIAERLAVQYPRENAGSTVVVDLLADRIVGDVRRPLYLLLGASALVLLIACANLSNILLARGVVRRQELAVRTALGAARRRIVRQLLTESFLLALVGSACGVLLARLAVTALAAMGPDVFRARPPSIDPAVLGVALGTSVATTLLFGLLPALRSVPRDPHAVLRGTSVRGGGGRTSWTRASLAVLQLSLAATLLFASTLVIASFARVLRVDPGIRGDHLLTMTVSLPRARYDSTRSTAFYQELEERIDATPGVRGVAFASLVPFGGDFDRIGISRIAGEPERQGSDMPEADRYIVTPSWFATMGVRLLRGRLLSSSDRIDSTPACLVDEVFARRVWGDRDPIGQAMKLPGRDDYATIVGVVSHVKTYGLDIDSPGQIYMSNAQYPWRWMSMVIRTAGDPASFTSTATRIVHSLDADEPVSDVRTMDELMANLLRARRFTLTLLGAFAGVAIALAIIGLYGVIAYGVAQRDREFGIRLALGARPRQIARLVLGEGARIAVAGAVLGTLGALAMGRVESSLLFEVSPHAPSALAGVMAGLVGVALVACLVPARKAMAADPSDVLRRD
ncbi:MAG TPA: ABC transporter permease [Gemmatimonadaceae bacterium]|nr:ABC transporter permease [Gemmatimonadaceae bacterium]